MKCHHCGKNNKKDISVCIKCGRSLLEEGSPITWKWHIKVLGVIYLCLAVFYFVLKAVY